jgi:hypothetical protein
MKAAQIVQLVNGHLATQKYADLQMEVLVDGVRHDANWWYVPIRPTRPFARTDQYYAVLADLEQDIEDAEGLNILLVPAA